MTAFAILVKSYDADLPYVDRLVDSFNDHNPEGIDLHLVVPQADLPLFAHLGSAHVHLMPEERFAEHLTSEPVAGFDPGYINQEIVKLCFWESGLADNWLCLDSDAQIVRDLHVSDFMADPTTPYTFLTEDAELRIESGYYDEHWVGRAAKLELIRQEIGLKTDRLRTVHGHAVFSATVLRAFVERFLAPRGWDYVDALAIAPYEPTWYSLWLQHDQTIPIVAREPVVKTFHTALEHLDYAVRGLTNADAARGYVAVVVNSNFSRDAGPLSLDDDPAETIARYATAAEISRALALRSGRALRPGASD